MTIIQTIQVENCALCGTPGQNAYAELEDRLHGVPGKWNYALCLECELLWLSNRPQSEHVPALYSSYYTHVMPEMPEFSTARSIQRSIKRGVVKSGLVDVLSAPTHWRELWYGDQEHARFLDVGCGNGQFAGIMQRTGWEVRGIEPDEQAATIARKFLDTPVHAGNLDTAEFDDGEFDLIRLSHVLEHLDDPLQALVKCYRLLRSGGRLIISTPNLHSLGHRYRFGVHWLHLDPPRHFFLFSPKSLHRLAKAAGFDEVRISTSVRGAQLTWLTSATIARLGKLPLQWRGEIGLTQQVEASASAMLESVLSRFLPVGEDLQLIAIR
jgi:2-polyprenyl-3-methyl-5-hydroxy-6-metoxy-1,4-benzoquinol methylase